MTPRAPAMSPDDRRATIVAAAIPLLAEHGAGLTTKTVADAAGIAEGTLFRVFPSKDDLLAACVADLFDTDALVTAVRSINREAPLRERLVAAVTQMQEWLRRIISVMSVLHASGADLERGSQAAHRAKPSLSHAAVDAAVVDLIGGDAAHLRLPALEVVNVLAHLTLASAHPFFPIRSLTPTEIVAVVLDGTRKDAR